MSSPIFSFVVPIYNVEKYLSNCIFSLMNQTFKDFEIILVDDGSTDNSGKIADHFSNIDYRIKVFHKKNGGVSDARNFGLSRASGEYVIFVDSDDWVSTHLLEYAKAEVAKSKADLIFFPYFDVNENMCIFRTNEKSFEKSWIFTI